MCVVWQARESLGKICTRLNDTVLEGSMETETVSARMMTSASFWKSTVYTQHGFQGDKKL